MMELFSLAFYWGLLFALAINRYVATGCTRRDILNALHRRRVAFVMYIVLVTLASGLMSGPVAFIGSLVGTPLFGFWLIVMEACERRFRDQQLG